MIHSLKTQFPHTNLDIVSGIPRSPLGTAEAMVLGHRRASSEFSAAGNTEMPLAGGVQVLTVTGAKSDEHEQSHDEGDETIVDPEQGSSKMANLRGESLFVDLCSQYLCTSYHNSGRERI